MLLSKKTPFCTIASAYHRECNENVPWKDDWLQERNVYHQYNLYLIEVHNCCLSRVFQNAHLWGCCLCRQLAVRKLTRLGTQPKCSPLGNSQCLQLSERRVECATDRRSWSNVWSEYEILHKCRQTLWAHRESVTVCFRAVSCYGVN